VGGRRAGVIVRQEVSMATFVMLANYTEQGIKSVQETLGSP
jgi:uncharacterized protein with GYD domain